MRCTCSSAMPEPVSETSTATCPFACVATRSVPPAAIASLALRNKLRKTCCSLPELPRIGGRLCFERSFQLNLGDTELVFQQLQRFFDHVVQIKSRELRRTGAGKIQQAIDDFRGPESLLRDLVQQRRHSLISPHLFGQHLGVGRNHGQREC